MKEDKNTPLVQNEKSGKTKEDDIIDNSKKKMESALNTLTR